MKSKFLKALALAGVCAVGAAGLVGCSLSDEQQKQINSAVESANSLTQTVETIETQNASIDGRVKNLEDALKETNELIEQASAKLDKEETQTSISRKDLSGLFYQANYDMSKGKVSQYSYTVGNSEWYLVNNEDSMAFVAVTHHTAEKTVPSGLSAVDVTLTADEEDDTYTWDFCYVIGREKLASEGEEAEPTEVCFAYELVRDLNANEDDAVVYENYIEDDDETHTISEGILPAVSGMSLPSIIMFFPAESLHALILGQGILGEEGTGTGLVLVDINPQDELDYFSFIMKLMVGTIGGNILSYGIGENDIYNVVEGEDGSVSFKVMKGLSINIQNVALSAVFIGNYELNAEGRIVSASVSIDLSPDMSEKFPIGESAIGGPTPIGALADMMGSGSGDDSGLPIGVFSIEGSLQAQYEEDSEDSEAYSFYQQLLGELEVLHKKANAGDSTK